MVWTRRILAVLAAVGGLSMAGGCSDSLFSEEVARTPYERYQVLHGDYRPMHEHQPAGPTRPALRQRLKPLEQH